MLNTHNTATYAAFFMEGLRDSGDYHELLDTWGHGCVELVQEMTSHSAYLGSLVDAVEKAFEDSLDFPGVFEYEVCSPFGKWFAEIVRCTGATPTEGICRGQLREYVLQFFCQNMETGDEKHRLLTAVETL